MNSVLVWASTITATAGWTAHEPPRYTTQSCAVVATCEFCSQRRSRPMGNCGRFSRRNSLKFRHRRNVLAGCHIGTGREISPSLFFFKSQRTKNLPPRLKFVRISVNPNSAKEKLEIVSGAAHFDLVRLRSPQAAQYKPPPFRHTTTAPLAILEGCRIFARQSFLKENLSG